MKGKEERREGETESEREIEREGVERGGGRRRCVDFLIFLYLHIPHIIFFDYLFLHNFFVFYLEDYNSIAADRYFQFAKRRHSPSLLLHSTIPHTASLFAFTSLVRCLWSQAVLEELSLQVRGSFFFTST